MCVFPVSALKQIGMVAGIIFILIFYMYFAPHFFPLLQHSIFEYSLLIFQNKMFMVGAKTSIGSENLKHTYNFIAPRLFETSCPREQ